MRQEDRLRSRCRMWLKDHLAAPWTWSAIEHGRLHRGSDEERAREWGRLQAQGVKTGLGDLMIWGPERRFANIELKWGDNDTRESQDRWANAIIGCGFRAYVVRSVAELCRILAEMEAPLGTLALPTAEAHDRALMAPPPVTKKRGAAKPGNRRASKKPSPKAIRKFEAMRRGTPC